MELGSPEWELAFMVFTVTCVALGYLRWVYVLPALAVAAMPICISSPHALGCTVAAVVVPAANAFFVPALRRGHMNDAQVVGACFGTLVAFVSRYFESWIPTAAMFGVAWASMRLAAWVSRRTAIFLAYLPAVVVVVFLMTVACLGSS